MQCPKCQFEHQDQSTECLRCGIVFAKYANHQQTLQQLQMVTSIEEREEVPYTLQEAREELRYRLLALPVALLVAWLLLDTGFVRIFLSMWVHEAGHAVTAWLCGFGAFPGPWRTPVSSERVLAVTVMLAAALIYGIFQSWRERRWSIVAADSLLLLFQLICTRLSYSSANALITFGGDAGCLLLGTILMTTFYVSRESAIHRGALRWGFVIIGAASFVDAFSTWWRARKDHGVIPFGEIEGVGLSDATRLVDDYGWSVDSMVNRYVSLGMACLGVIVDIYVVGILRARAAVARKERAEAGSNAEETESEEYKVETPAQRIEPEKRAEAAKEAAPSPPPVPERYRLVFDGAIELAADPEETKNDIARLLRCERDRVDSLFCGRRIVLKKGLDHATAQQLRNAFNQTGAICTVETDQPR
jgi:hypothetical protein